MLKEDVTPLLQELINAMKYLVEHNLVNPRGGNGSVRVNNYIWITPSGVLKNNLDIKDLIVYDVERNVFIGYKKPSIEFNMHKLIYLNIDYVNAILHAHPPLSTALCDVLGLRWLNETLSEVKYSVGKASIAVPAEPGTLELANNVLDEVRKGSRVVVIPIHGVVAVGRNIGEALDAIVSLEESAKYYIVKNLLRRV